TFARRPGQLRACQAPILLLLSPPFGAPLDVGRLHRLGGLFGGGLTFAAQEHPEFILITLLNRLLQLGESLPDSSLLISRRALATTSPHEFAGADAVPVRPVPPFPVTHSLVPSPPPFVPWEIVAGPPNMVVTAMSRRRPPVAPVPGPRRPKPGPPPKKDRPF